MKKISFILALLIILMTFPAISIHAAQDPYTGIDMVQYDNVVNAGSGFAVDDRGFIKQLRGGAYVVFKNINFGENGPTALDMYFGTDSTYTGTVDFFLDTVENKPFATVYTFDTKWAKSVATLEIEEEITGKHDLIIRGSSGVANLYNVLFYEKQVAGAGIVYKPGDYFDDISDSPYRNEINMFYEMGAIKPFSETEFEPDLYVNRGDFAAVMYTLLGNESIGSIPFDDVAADNVNIEAISWMYGAGLIKGDGNLKYRPYDFITPAEAATIAVRALGFEKLALAKGGYPAGYMAVARTEDLFDNITPKKYLTRGELAQFLYNFLNADYLELVAISGDSVEYSRNNGILGINKGIYTAEGVVTATSYTGLKVVESNLSDNEVMINGEKYLVGDTAAAGLLGYETIIYYKEEGGRKVLTNIRPSSASKVTTLLSADVAIDVVSETALEYYDESNKAHKIRFDKDTSFIYNGKAADRPLSELINKGDFCGKITYIDNPDSDTVLIEQHKSVIIGAVDTFDMVIRNHKFTDTYSLNPDEVDATLMKDGEPFAFGQLTCGMMLSVFESKNQTGKKRIVAYVEENTVSGAVEQIADDNLVINGKEYVTKFCDGTSVRLDLNGSFTLNYLNEIIAYSDAGVVPREVNPGVYLESEIQGNGFHESCVVRMFTPDNVIGVFDCASKVVADGVTVELPSEIMNGKGKFLGLEVLGANSLIRYKLNSQGEISVIDTEYAGAGGDYDTLSRLTETTTKFYFNESTKAFCDTKGKSVYMYEDEPEAFVFEAGVDEEKLAYTAAPMDLISAETSANCDVYTVTDSDIPMVDYFVWSDRITNTEAKYSSPFVYTRTSKTVDADGDEAYVIYGKTSSGEVKFPVTEEYLSKNAGVKKIVTSLRPGDVVRFRLDIAGEIYSAEVIYFCDGASLYNDVTPLMNSDKSVKVYDQFQRYRFVKGTVVAKDKNTIRIDCKNGDTVSNEYFNCASLNVVDYDMSDSRIDIGTTTASIVPGDEVLVCVSAKQVALVLRYRD